MSAAVTTSKPDTYSYYIPKSDRRMLIHLKALPRVKVDLISSAINVERIDTSNETGQRKSEEIQQESHQLETVNGKLQGTQ